jgi:hypothetical protein
VQLEPEGPIVARAGDLGAVVVGEAVGVRVGAELSKSFCGVKVDFFGEEKLFLGYAIQAKISGFIPYGINHLGPRMGARLLVECFIKAAAKPYRVLYQYVVPYIELYLPPLGFRQRKPKTPRTIVHLSSPTFPCVTFNLAKHIFAVGCKMVFPEY